MTRGEEVVGRMESELERIKPQLESAEAFFDKYLEAKWADYEAKAISRHRQTAKWREDELESADAIFDQHHKEIWREDEFNRHEEQDKQLVRYKKELEDEEIQFSKKINNLKDMIRKAEVLIETFTRREIQRKAAKYSNPINFIEKGIISKKLRTIGDEITLALTTIYIPNFAKFEQNSLKQYINYFVLFPPDFKVPPRRLIALWVAEGLVQSKKNDDQSAQQTAEQIAERHLGELIRQEVIHVEKTRSGKVKACWIDRDTRNNLLGKAEVASFLRGKDGNVLRLVDHNVGRDGDTSFIKIDGKPIDTNFTRDAISFLSFNTQEAGKPGVHIGEFLRKCISAGCFIWLKVLDLERVFRPNLPDTLHKLIALKYLGLRWTYLEQLPDSVNKLFNLQVLDVKHTYISVLPRSIWCMEFLRHLYLSEVYRTRFPDPTSKVTLTALQTLWGAFVDKDTRVEEGLDTLLNIRKLGLSCKLSKSETAETTESETTETAETAETTESETTETTESETTEMKAQWKAIDKWISKLKYLETLRLKSRDEENHASDLHLTSLEGNQNLSTVYLLGKLKHSILDTLPVSLTDITLSGSKLNLDPMEILGRLPNLLILRLLAHSVVENDELYCSGRRFKKLKVLWIWELKSLKKFEADDESLPCLEELEIRSCKNLEKLPDRLRQLENLEIRLTSMPKEFVRREKIIYADVLRDDDQDLCILKNTRRQRTSSAQLSE